MTEETKPLFEAIKCHSCGHKPLGLHYTIGKVLHNIESLKALFPDGEADDLNFVLFSTSGVHGSYRTLDDIEESIKKYGFDPDFRYSDAENPDDYWPAQVTILVVHPRVVALRYGCCNIESLEDLEYLKKLRASSTAVVQTIGYKN